MTDHNLLHALNESQRAAVEYNDGPELVIAGAGSGKTRVLTYKIAYLLQQGLKPWSILALTFTNKAAREMKERIAELVGSQAARSLNMGTFHSIFARILRAEAAHIGYNANYTIYDEGDSLSLIKSIIKEMGLDDKQYKPSTVRNRISAAKNALVLAGQYAQTRAFIEQDNRAKMHSVHQIYLAYQQRLKAANAMDFDDLLTLTHLLFEQQPKIREKYAGHFSYILVDEYQDTNYAQQRILLQLAGQSRRICVVGDDYQSIYGFRGADINNILSFQQVYQGARLFKLEENYRSTRHIVAAANSLMKHNTRQIDKDVYSNNEEGEKLILKEVYSDREEASVVCKDIRRIKRAEDCEYSNFAILYRTNSQSRSFEEELRRQNIPYRIFGGLSFYQRKEIKDIIAYFRAVVNPDDEEAIKRIINYPTRGIGNTTVSKIVTAARAQNASFWDILQHPKERGADITQGTATKLARFTTLLSGFATQTDTTDAFTLGRQIITQSGIYADLYSSKDPEYLSRQENMEEFLSAMNDFTESRKEEGRERECSLANFLQEVSLLTDADKDDGAADKVSLMTIHAAKGLEFSTVFIVGLEENIFPNALTASSPRELEEERRLLYVAITRAKRHCIMTCAKNRWRYGSVQFDTPSRFIQDIDPRFILNAEADEYESFTSRPHRQDTWHRRQESKPTAVETPRTSPHLTRLPTTQRPTDNAASDTEDHPCAFDTLKEGTVIAHQRFGVGTILHLEGTGENKKATVEFKNTGTKQLLLKFARFTILNS